MGRYYTGDIDGKFMFAIQSSDAHERFGAVEEESYYVPYVVFRHSYAEICAELDSIKQKGHVDKVDKMFNENIGYNKDVLKKYNISEHDLSEWADYQIGLELKEFFDDNPNLDECRFQAEI